MNSDPCTDRQVRLAANACSFCRLRNPVTFGSITREFHQFRRRYIFAACGSLLVHTRRAWRAALFAESRKFSIPDYASRNLADPVFSLSKQLFRIAGVSGGQLTRHDGEGCNLAVR